MEKLERMKSIGENGLIGLDEMAARVDNAVTTVVLIGRAEYLYNPVILNSLVSKLNIFLKLQWGEHVGRLGDGPVSLERFNNWLQDKVEAIGNAGAWETSESNSQNQTKEEVQEARNLALKEQVKPSHSLLARKCLKCNVPSHTLKDCKNFAQMKNDDRLHSQRKENGPEGRKGNGQRRGTNFGYFRSYDKKYRRATGDKTPVEVQRTLTSEPWNCSPASLQ
ncbi:hypothetical protein GE061_012245 [Apolygus lucorum]|uniref:Uncharacterized protein n=1 Tax=Apolygus lucorum TaxID=248454 RepID=A0A8S9XRT7_APOLU|nr:hypothetical protein GE061_012245 [Apolygus lucorum]